MAIVGRIVTDGTSNSMSSTAAPEPKNEQEVLGIYRQMNSELQSMVQSYTKFEMDRNEHR